ncbi:phosphoribosyl-AMP cyclohydrolase, partial [Rhodoplanes tepidamans]|uniref:phosphoribosyl-AMP cyclohydrolase n=1 Tax=Rhodoplanes tepidamans TaxID=200616 RepID=UPI003F5A2E4C
MKSVFAPRGTTEQIEEGRVFAPKFDADGLIPAIVADAWSGDVLMLAWMNDDALVRSIETCEAWFYSRSRGKLWKKGESSGHVLRIIELKVDCDQDALLLRVEQTGPGVCHTGRASCFYRAGGRGAAGGPPPRGEVKKAAEVLVAAAGDGGGGGGGAPG